LGEGGRVQWERNREGGEERIKIVRGKDLVERERERRMRRAREDKERARILRGEGFGKRKRQKGAREDKERAMVLGAKAFGKKRKRRMGGGEGKGEEGQDRGKRRKNWDAGKNGRRDSWKKWEIS
jgi:hypothetical protein